MSGVNKSIILGHLGEDPDVKYSPTGSAVANMTIATSESWKDKNTGEKQEKTEWHRIVAFGKTAEVCGKYLKKGSLAYIEGKLQTRKWLDKEGKDRFTTEIVAEKIRMFGGQPQAQRTEDRAASQAQPEPDDDIPF